MTVPGHNASSGCAWDVPATRAYWRRLMTVVLVPGIVALGLLVLAAVSWTTSRGDSRARTAADAATVTNVSSHRVGRGGVQTGDITVQFPAGAPTNTAVIGVGRDVIKYAVGQTVTVHFQPSKPTNISVVGTSVSSSWIVSAFFGAILGAAALWAGRHVRRIRDVLRRHPWQARPSRITEIPFRAGFRVRAQIVVVLWDPDEDRETIVMPVGLRRLNPEFQPVTWLCGDLDDERVVISTPGGQHPLLACWVR
jgi:hypothetical protein